MVNNQNIFKTYNLIVFISLLFLISVFLNSVPDSYSEFGVEEIKGFILLLFPWFAYLLWLIKRFMNSAKMKKIYIWVAVDIGCLFLYFIYIILVIFLSSAGQKDIGIGN